MIILQQFKNDFKVMLLRFAKTDLSNEPKGYYTCLFTVDKKVSPATMLKHVCAFVLSLISIFIFTVFY